MDVPSHDSIPPLFASKGHIAGQAMPMRSAKRTPLGLNGVSLSCRMFWGNCTFYILPNAAIPKRRKTRSWNVILSAIKWASGATH